MTRVGPAGLRGLNLWGRPRALSWDEAGRMRPGSLLGVPVLKLGGGRRPVWLPLVLAELERRRAR